MAINKIMKTEHLMRAVFFGFTYALLVSIMSMFAKLASPHTTNSMIVFTRFTIGLFYVILLLSIKYFKGKQVSLATRHLGWHVFRAATSFISLFLLFYSLKYLPLIDTNLLFLTTPLFVPILGALFLGAKTSKKNWFIILLGFLGVVVVIKPGTEMMQPATFLALLAGLFAASSLMTIRELGKSDSAHTIMFYYFLIAFMLSTVFAIINWQTPNLQVLLLLIGVGVTSALAQECAVRALINAPAKIVSPLMYSIIPFSGILDWLVWGHIPTTLNFVGITIISISCVLMILLINNKKERV